MTTENTIFKLIEIEYCDEESQHLEFEVNRNRIGCYSSLDEVGRAIKEIIKSTRFARQNPLFGFLIEEYPIDAPAFWWANSRRIYLPDGSFLDEIITLLPDGCSFLDKILPDNSSKTGYTEDFCSHPPDKIRFVSGDLAELRNGEMLTPEVVAHVPFTLEATPKQKGSRGITLLSPSVSNELWKKCIEATMVEIKISYYGKISNLI